ncbi:MAG: LOG family protein [bacterium]
MPYVAIFGSSKTPEGHPHFDLAYRLAFRLATAGYGVCSGGYWGIMDAATRGARDAGGEAVGVTLEYFSNKRNGANPLLSREDPKRSLPDRLTTLLEMSNAHVVLPGSIGTLAEMFVSWNLLVSGGTKPLILLGEEWERLLDVLEQHTEIRPKDRAKLIFSRTAEDAFEQITRRVAL